MLRYILNRLLHGVITVWFIATPRFSPCLVPASLSGDKAMTPNPPQPGKVRPDQPSSSRPTSWSQVKGDFALVHAEREVNASSSIESVSRDAWQPAIVFAALGASSSSPTATYRNKSDVVIMFLVILGISSKLVFAALGSWPWSSSMRGRGRSSGVGWGP